jgi:hypothetical protein
VIVDRPKQRKAFLGIVMPSINALDGNRIPERCPGHLEGNTMIALVDNDLDVVPLELISHHDILITSSLLKRCQESDSHVKGALTTHPALTAVHPDASLQTQMHDERETP